MTLFYDEHNQLKDSVNAGLGILNKGLLDREVWGDINFRDSAHLFETIREFYKRLNSLSFEWLPVETGKNFSSRIKNLNTVLHQIDTFNPASNTKSQSQLANETFTRFKELIETSGPWIGYLKVFQNEVFEELPNRIKEVHRLYIKARSDAEDAREFIEKAGTNIFAGNFKNQSIVFGWTAAFWLVFTAIFFAASVSSVWYIYDNPVATSVGASPVLIIQGLVMKIFFISLLVSGTLWCGKQYKTMAHLATLFKHKAISLDTLKVFKESSKDTQVQDAIALEVARSIFNFNQTGYLDGKDVSPSPASHLLEITKSAKDLPGRQ